MTRYAANTSVSADRSRSEAERVLARYGATGFAYAWDRREVPIDPPRVYGPKTEVREFVSVEFKMVAAKQERIIRLVVPMPTEREAGSQRKLEAATRQRWRALVLVLKAKLEAVASGISTLEAEFLANVVTGDGRTIGDVILPRISEAVSAGRLLPAKGGTES